MSSLESLGRGPQIPAAISNSGYTVQLGSVHLEWNGDNFLERVKASAAEGLTDAAVHVARKMKENIGIQGPPTSSPGEFPHMDTTSLNQSISIDVATPDNLVSAAGVAAEAINSESKELVDHYALGLEFGTTKTAPRPWCVRTLDEERGAVFGTFVETTARNLGIGGVRGVS